jgi:phosphate uptake regulator
MKMKRKLVELGGSMFISLPSKYTKENSLGKGDEIDIEILKGQLVLSTTPISRENAYSLNIEKQVLIVKRYITALFRRGYSPIKITYDNPDSIAQVRSTISDELIGIEIISQKPNEIILQSFASEENNELENLLQRIFFLLGDMSNEMLKAFQNSNKNLAEIEKMDIEVDKFTNYCCRLIFKGSNISGYKNIILYTFIKNLEYLADSFKDYCKEVRENQITLNAGEIKIFKDILAEFDLFQKAYFSYSIDTCEELIKLKIEINERIKSTNKNRLFFLEKNIIRRFNDITSNLIELQLS